MSEEELLILQVSNGIIGAEAFAREAIELDHDAAVKGLKRLLDWDVPGEYFYALWNDCCERDTALAIEVMNDYPKFLIYDALDWFSHIRKNLKNLKEVKKQQKKNLLMRKIKKILLVLNLLFSLSSFIFAIINGIVLKGKYSDYIYCFAIVIIGFCYISIIDDYTKASLQLIKLERENCDLENLYESLDNDIKYLNLAPKIKLEIQAEMYRFYRRREEMRNLKWQRFAKK